MMSNRPARLIARALAAFAISAALAACDAPDAPRGEGSPDPATAATSPLPDAAATTVEPASPAGATTSTAGAFPATFRALGTEPFWAVHVSDETLRFMTPEDQEGTVVPFTRAAAGDDEVALDAVLEGRKLHLVGRIAECSDGMSDRVYPYTITITLDDETLNGCARPMEGLFVLHCSESVSGLRRMQKPQSRYCR